MSTHTISTPPANSPIRELFDMDHLVEILEPGNRLKLPAFGDVKRKIRREGLGDGVDSVNVVCMRADGSIWLVRFGPQGGAKNVWKFC